jgi:hypothetical protein
MIQRLVMGLRSKAKGKRQKEKGKAQKGLPHFFLLPC